jgi:hypothetical protein
MMVRGRTRRLHNENIPPADVLIDLNERLLIRKRRDRCIAQRYPDRIGNPLREGSIRITRKNLQLTTTPLLLIVLAQKSRHARNLWPEKRRSFYCFPPRFATRIFPAPIALKL